MVSPHSQRIRVMMTMMVSLCVWVWVWVIAGAVLVVLLLLQRRGGDIREFEDSPITIVPYEVAAKLGREALHRDHAQKRAIDKKLANDPRSGACVGVCVCVCHGCQPHTVAGLDSGKTKGGDEREAGAGGLCIEAHAGP